MRLHSDGVDHRIGAPAAGHVTNRITHGGGDLVEVHRPDPASTRAGESLRHIVDGDHGETLVSRDARRHVPDRTQPENSHGAALRDVGIDH